MALISTMQEVGSLTAHGVESCKIMFVGEHFLFPSSNTFAVSFVVLFSHTAQRHRQTDR